YFDIPVVLLSDVFLTYLFGHNMVYTPTALSREPQQIQYCAADSESKLYQTLAHITSQTDTVLRKPRSLVLRTLFREVNLYETQKYNLIAKKVLKHSLKTNPTIKQYDIIFNRPSSTESTGFDAKIIQTLS